MAPLFRMTALGLLAVLAGCGGGGDEFSELTARSTVADEPAEVESPAATSYRALALQAGTGNIPQRARPMQLETGNISIAVSSAGVCEFDHLWISVRAIRIYQTDAAADTDSDAYEMTMSPPRRIDLAGLNGGLLAELGTAALPVGHYQALRLVLSANGPNGAPDAAVNAVQMNGGRPRPLATPAAAHRGIKASYYFNVMPGQTGDVVLGFDPCTSMVQAGNAGQYILEPAISARPRSQDQSP